MRSLQARPAPYERDPKRARALREAALVARADNEMLRAFQAP